MIRYKTYTSAEDTAPTNNGGFLGGLGYVGQKIGAGFMQTFEGVWDYTAGGIADIFGADEWAKRQMDEDWFGTWYSDIDKNFNPGKGWKIAGDVAGGIGNVGAGAAAVALAVGSAVAITAATGGSGLPVAASTIATTVGALTAGLGAAGNATKEAYRETGELTGKEYGYGALSGATEAALEIATAGIGKGSGKLMKSVGKAVAGEATEEAAKVGAKAIVKEVAKDFATEAFEEGAAEYLTPKYKRMTYDPNARDATGEEIAYAAFVGGLTGAVMNGANGAVTLTSDAISGQKAKASGQVELIEKLGKQISEEEAKSPSGYELLANIKKIYDRGGDSAVRVGQLKRMEAAARLLPAVEKSAMAIVSAPQYAVERFARMGVTEINGKPLSAEMLTEAIDLDHGNKAALKTLRQAISKNPILATLAMADATAKLQLDSTKYTEGIAREGALGTSGDWNTFLATASAEEKAAVGKMFGVENIDALDYGTARAYAMAYAESDEGKATVRRAVRAKDAVEAIAENDKPLPKVIVTTDGARRYGEVGIIKEGGEVRFYDYTTGRMTQPMTVREANAKLAQDRAAALSETAPEAKTETKTEAKKPTADEEIHTWALENIKKYNELTGRERQEVRATIRQARALGISEADTITYATVAARSGVRVVFSKARCLRRVIVDEGGKPVTKVGFSDGFYNHDTNEIVVNPEGKRSPTKLLLHELAHALYKNKGFARLLDRAAKKMDDDRKKEITNRYTDAGQKQYIPEEHAVHHAEDVIGNDATLERLLRDEPTMGDKILSFFGLAKTDYKGNERLSRSAGRLYARYKATFERFAAANRGTVRIEGIGDSKGIRDAFAGELSEKADKGMLAKAKAMLEGGADSEKVRQETGWFQGYDGKWRYEIDDSTAVWHLDTAKPDPKRLVHFGERIFKLTDLLDHPAMYEAYPQLKDVTVWENPDAPVDGYVVGKSTDHITVRSLSSMGDLSKDLVIHEVQHLIQNIEGFTSGASKDQFEYKSWGPKEWEAYEKRNEIASKLYAVLRRHGEHITARDIAAMRQEFSETDSILDSNFMLLSSLADSNKRVDYLRDEYYKQVRILQLTTPSGQYHAVAGEIEAYDAQFRRRKTAEERKNTRPNIDREDAIVLGDTGIELEKHFDEYPYNMQTVIQEYMDSVDQDIIDFVNDAMVETNKKRLEYMHRDLVNDLPQKVIQEINAIVGFDVSDYKITINGEGVHHIDNMHGKNGKHDHSMQEEKDLARIQYILSHADRAEATVNSSGEIVKDHQYRNADNTESHVVSILKKINGTYYVVCAVPDSRAHAMRVKSAYISKKEVNQEFDAETAPNNTPETNLDITSMPSVAQSSEDVKTQVENNFAESTMVIRHAEDGAVVKSPVTEMVISTFKGGVRDSITTEFVALPKQAMSVTTGEGQIMHKIEGIEATPVKGIGGQTIAGFTGREVREWAMKGNGFTAVQIENVDRFMDEMGKFMKKAGVTYRFIGLTDVENAKLHYTYDAQGEIKSIVLSAMVKNGDYPVNFDLSSICKKRVAMSTLIDKLANRGTLDNGTVALTPAQIFSINTALKNAGYETACLGCFVESKRYNAMAWAKSFVDKWNKAVKAVNPNATYFGYGDGTNTTEVTVAQANRIDVATKEYIAKTKTKRMEQALSKYKEKAAKGLPLISGKKQMVNGKEIETFTKAARDRLIKSETLSDALKERYLNADVSTLGMEDVETLLEHGVLPGASISNKQAVTELVKSGEAYQHLLRPSDLLTAKGIERLEALPNFHGVLYGHYGSGTPKLMQSFTPYNSEIALLPAKKADTSLAEYLYSIAGVRMQSFSDFQVQNIYDYLQMVADLAAKKLPAHAYTKEISFAKLLGMTGIKVNLSVMFDIDPTVDAAHAGLTRRIPFIHKGEYAKVVLHDEQGDWVYNVGDYQTQRAFAEADPDADLRFLQSIGFADAVKLQTTEGYSANCGIIGVGYSDLHILAMLDDNRIRYVIPYHASSLPADIKVATNIALGTDYTPYQNTMKIDSIVDKNGKKVEWSVKEAYRRLGSGKAVLAELNAKIKSEGWEVKTKKAQNGHGTYGLYEDLGKTRDPRKTAENFMDWCAGNGSLPLFYQFASHANYYKLLYDYNVYDCVSEEYAPQTAVTNTYPAGENALPTNAAAGGFDATHFIGILEKQMAFMNRYSESLDSDLDAMASSLTKGRRDALPEDATYVSPTAGAVGKTKAEYKATFGDKVFTASTRTYIDTVDELYGIETYLRKVGKMDKAAVEALVQQARAARSQAQTMIGTAQYNVFSDKVERMGDGLLEILKPTKNWTAKKKGAFDDYLLNQLNIDRMTLESRTTMWAAPVRARLAKQQSDLANLKKLLSRMERKVEDLATEIGNARGHRDTAKLSKTREKWRTRIAELENRKSAAEALISQYEKDIKAASRAVDKTKAELDAMIVKDKPVFGKDETLDEHGNVKRDHDITADESRDIVKKYEAAYPEFAEMAKRLYAYLDNVQKLRVEAGLITQDMADHMKKLYPHYVPSYRDVEGGGIASIKGKNAMEVSKTVRKAQGGNQDILDVAVSIAMQTDEVLKAGQINKLSRALYDAAKSSGDETYVKILSEEVVGAQENAVDAVMRPKPGQLTFYADGKRVTLAISKELLYGFDGLRKPSVDFESPVVAALAKMNEWYKRGVTSLNPAFAIRNPIRDFQDAGLNSKHPLLFAKQMAGLAQKGIASNSERWELYRAMGGFSSTVFDGALHKQAGYAGFESISELFSAAKGETDLKAAWRKLSAPAKALFRSVENANAFLEQTTRFAEFCASLDAGDSPAVALNNSAEVTTNFGRRGRITKVLNATVMPFLNPAVQGFDKLFRNVGDAFTGGHWVRGVATLITKAAIIGIAPMLLNSIMYDDDEEYEKLRETDKENNFLIKTADGTFIKIPRGRLASVIGGLYNRGDKLAKGEDAELAGYASNVVSQITPVENVSRTIFSPLFDVKNNRTWYGGEIEGREFEDTAPRDRYDESTSSIAVWIGQAINYSPKKVHYLLDQYSGVIGDFALPATSKKEKRDFFSGNFTLDSVTSNKLSERFYDAYDKTAYADTAGDEAATYRLKYLNDVKKAVRDMNKELDEIRNSDLSNTEKLQQTRVVRSLINAAYDSALKSLDAVNAAIEATKGLDTAAIEAGYTKDMAEKLREAEVNRRVFGAEYALKQYNEKTYEKYVLLNGGGIGYDELYAFHFSTIGLESDLDKRGNVIEGSKKKKILAVINSLDIPKEQKLILLYSRGYSAKDGDIKGVSAARAKTVLAAYIAKAKGLTKAQREELAKACGLKVTNGRISVK